MDEQEELQEELDEIKAEVESVKKSPIRLEWIISAGTVLTMIISGVYALTSAEERINTRLTTIETTAMADEKADSRRIGDYDTRIESLETEIAGLRQELSIRREYQRHVHAHICLLLSEAHGPNSVKLEKVCSLPQPEFKK